MVANFLPNKIGRATLSDEDVAILKDVLIAYRTVLEMKMKEVNVMSDPALAATAVRTHIQVQRLIYLFTHE